MPGIKFEIMSDAYISEASEIYNYYVKNTTVTFHTEYVSYDQMKEILFREDPIYITYAIMDDEQLIGYGYIAPYHKRQAYRISAEVTIYVKPDYTGKGIGSKTLTLLEDHARQKGLHSLLAVICAENTASIALFGKSGYDKCAHYKEVGMKFNRILDVIVMQKILN